jgi:hypothetical protein
VILKWDGVALLVQGLGNGLDDRDSIPGRSSVLFVTPSRSSLDRPSLLPKGYRGLNPREKGPGREVDHSLSSNAKINNSWSYTTTSPIRLHGVVLKHRDNFTFYLQCVLNAPSDTEGRLSLTETSGLHFWSSCLTMKAVCKVRGLPFHSWKSPEIVWGEMWSVWRML